MYLHGRGYCVCSIDNHRGLAARLALACQSCILIIAYRLAPENPYPAALEDALIAYRWLLARVYLPGKLPMVVIRLVVV